MRLREKLAPGLAEPERLDEFCENCCRHPYAQVEERLTCLRELHLQSPWVALHGVKGHNVDAEGRPKLRCHGESNRPPGEQE